MAKDPVCGMEIDERTAAGRSEYNGKTYYFCAPGCLRAFVNEPEKYVRLDNGENLHSSTNSLGETVRPGGGHGSHH
jgi:Cu+-exporting ATPase